MSSSAAVDFSHVTFISAGAGSGKTYRLTEDLQRLLVSGEVDPAGVVGMTFTVKAAGELRDRVCERLISRGYTRLAEQAAQSLLGTVHSVCERLLKQFAFELGISPVLNVVSLEDAGRLFKQALDEVLDLTAVRDINALAARLGQDNWQGAVQAVADKIRDNNLSATQANAMAAESADALLAFCNPADREYDARTVLLSTIEFALGDIDLQADTTKTTAEYVERLIDACRQLREVDCPWEVFLSLCGSKGGKKSEAAWLQVQAAAAGYERSAGFQQDVRSYIEAIVSTAASAIDRFQQLKTRQGLIDFGDMEQLTLAALDLPAVRARLQEEMQLLMVDEFQDTNPMQLALYIKLAELADKVILVGDVKQAIYAFRGCDPDLVFATLEGMSAASAATDVLPHNWRSRSGLVHYTNALFINAFAGEIPAEKIRLQPVREDTFPDGVSAPEVISWQLAGNQDQRNLALAEGVAELVRSGHQIVDPESGVPRPVQWGDIAVLARTNDQVESIARTLSDCRVPMKMTLQGLLSVPEVILARACLRRLNDESDTLATAEIWSLADCVDPREWLTDRLRWLQEGTGINQHWAQEQHPVVQRLAQLAADNAPRSPLEVVARVLNDVGIRHLVSAWGPDAVKVAQRQKNLDAFLDLAVQYEGVCEAQFEAATLTGFLFWLENPASPELDLQPVVTTGNAVHVLTYHRAKGLEWPVVVASDFAARKRSAVWDVRIELDGEFDVSQPLANRTLRFWPNLFGKRSKGIELLANIMNSEEAAGCERRSDAESRRLAYVGMTRARDTMVIALGDKDAQKAPAANTWLSTFYADFMLPQPDNEHMRIDKHDVSTRCQALTGEPVTTTLPDYHPRWFESRPRQSFQPRVVSPSRQRADTGAAATVSAAGLGEVIELGERVAIRTDDMNALGNALHAVIAAECVNPGQADRTVRAARLLQAHGVGDAIEPDQACAVAWRLLDKLSQQFEVLDMRVEYPVSAPLGDGQLMKGFVDLLVETPDAWLLIDHKSSPRRRSAWLELAAEHAGQLAMYADAVGAVVDKPVRCFLHLAVTGVLLEVQPG